MADPARSPGQGYGGEVYGKCISRGQANLWMFRIELNEAARLVFTAIT